MNTFAAKKVLKSLFPYLILLLISNFCFSQKKTLEAYPLDGKILIDGILDEEQWQQAQIATDFIMFEPDNGVPLAYDKRTEVRVLYNDDALYIGAILYDNTPHLIQKEITQRDRFGVSEHFGVFINGFNDGQQDFRFFVSAAGVQMDCLATETEEDFTWDAIWDSAVKITDEGWVVEMEIPYAALRFSNKDEQIWGLNFMRELRRDRQKYAWNPIDATIGAVIPQAGLLTGIKNIKPPTRLFFIPYASGYVEQQGNNTQHTIKGGMDIKYGINDAFTLDAILIPDFGQAAFDNVILNLGPFEQQFNENRPFFTEGTDIFNKGNLLYSRRIGGPPSGQITTQENEEVIGRPSTVNLINATKISGRTSGGLGVGFLNSITERTYANIRNTDTDEIRKELVEPLTNYNITVLDQRFRGNSSIALVNTNVWRQGEFRDANVSALVFDLNTRANTYNLSGDFKYSSINDINNTQGFNTNLSFAKTYSRHRYIITGNYVSKDYNPNDLGINFMTNFHNASATYSFRTLNPVGKFNAIRLNSRFYTEIQNTTGKIQETWQNITGNATTRKNDFYFFGIYTNPFETYDFYEARIFNRYVVKPASHGFWIGHSTNYNRVWALDQEISFRNYEQENRTDFSYEISPRYRFSDKLSLIYSYNYFQQNSDIGWVAFDGDDIILAERNRVTQTHAIQGKMAVNNKMTFNLVARYYWSYADNINYLTLQENGTWVQNNEFSDNKNSNFNLWNFDLSYSWWFAPGSEISVLYRNNAQEFSQIINKSFNENVSGLFNNNLNHIFSISIRYFVDYNKAKNWI